MKPLTENIIELSTIEILQSQGWEYADGKDISPEGLFCVRESFSKVILLKRDILSFRKLINYINKLRDILKDKVSFMKGKYE